MAAAEFWAGYLSGIAGIIIGSPLDIIKTRSQSQLSTASSDWYERPTSLIKGVAAPIVGYGALNAILFYSYNRSLEFLGDSPGSPSNLWKIWFGGAIGGLTCFVVSTPTELIKCRAQVSRHQQSWTIARDLYRTYGLRGFYIGGLVTSWRDAIGYGFYFWSYEGCKKFFPIDPTKSPPGSLMPEINTLACGGIAGCVTWASVYPLDVIKTQLQVQPSIGHYPTLVPDPELGAESRSQLHRYLGAWQITKRLYRNGGFRVFWNGVWVCLGRAFIVNAFTFFAYEWAVKRLKTEDHYHGTAVL